MSTLENKFLITFLHRAKASELWDTIVRLETEKYDLEERQKRQDYDVSHFCIYSSSKTFAAFCKM